MKAKMKRYFSFLLVMLLLVGMVPHAYAAEASEPTTAAQAEETEAGTEPVDTTEPTEPTEPTIPKEESQPNTVPEEPVAVPDEYGIMPLASTQSGIMLFDYVDNGNYTTTLNYQVAVDYKPNGTGGTKTAYIKNMGWHFARYGGVAYLALLCFLLTVALTCVRNLV